MFQDSVRNGQKVELRRGAEGELGNEHQLFELQGGGDDFFAEVGEVIAVRAAHFFDESVEPQAFQQARHLPAAVLGQVVAQGSVL